MDISALVEEIKSHRFDGYGPARIADEIDRFRSGTGTGSLSGAVDALGEVATALTETEDALRTELGELGVSWHGAAGDAAGNAVAEQAGFSGEMATTLDGAARALFAQGDAFNRTRDKLPGSDEVRKAVGGTHLGDELMSLIGFETDHADEVARAREATQHAVQVLNEYAAESGDNLGSAETGTDPKAMAFSVASRPPAAADAGGAPILPAHGVRPGSGPPPAGTTAATTAYGVAPAPAPAEGPPIASRAAPFAAGAGAGASVEPPTPPAGFALPTANDPSRHHTSSTSTAGAVPPATPAAPVGGGAVPGGGYGGAGTGHGAGGGYPGATGYGDARTFTGREAGASRAGASGQATAGHAGGRVIGRLTVPAPGTQAPVSGVINTPYTPLSPLGSGNGAQDASLARGRMSGLATQPPSGGSVGAFHGARAKPGMSAVDIGAGAAAIGAGGVAGALSGERGRQGRGGASERQLSFGTGPDEDEAEAAERIESDVADEPDDED